MYIKECLSNLKQPKKVFIHGIPKNYSKQSLVTYFDVFGEIDSIILIDKVDQQTDNAFVTFENYEDAKKCVNKKSIKLKCGKTIVMGYSRPKFSGFMMHKIEPKVKQIIKDITNGMIEYRPEDFESINIKSCLKGSKKIQRNNKHP